MMRLFSFFWHPSHPEFSSLTPGGMLTPIHLLFTLFLALIGWRMYRELKALPNKDRQRWYQYLAIGLIGLEIIRMGWNMLASDAWYAKDVLPLYTCGIFVMIFPFYAFSKRYGKWMKGFIGLGSFLAGSFFLLLPSTGLGMFPLWHLNTWISSIMHLTMAVIGALFFFDQNETYTWKDILASTLIITFFAVISVIYNTLDPNTNFFFLANPLPNTPLTLLVDWFGQPGYGISIYVLHLLIGLTMFFLHQRYIIAR
ncbi:MAG: hypothetical protein ACO3H6_03725 [Bacilli bacterium]